MKGRRRRRLLEGREAAGSAFWGNQNKRLHGNGNLDFIGHYLSLYLLFVSADKDALSITKQRPPYLKRVHGGNLEVGLNHRTNNNQEFSIVLCY